MFNIVPVSPSATSVELLQAYRYGGMEKLLKVLSDRDSVAQVQRAAASLFHTALSEDLDKLSPGFRAVLENFRRVAFYQSTAKQHTNLYNDIRLRYATSSQLEEFLRLAMITVMQDTTTEIVPTFEKLFTLAKKMEPEAAVEEHFVDVLLKSSVGYSAPTC